MRCLLASSQLIEREYLINCKQITITLCRANVSLYKFPSGVSLSALVPLLHVLHISPLWIDGKKTCVRDSLLTLFLVFMAHLEEAVTNNILSYHRTSCI